MTKMETITKLILQEIEFQGFSGTLTPKTRKWFRHKIRHILYLIQEGYNLEEIPKIARDKTLSDLNEWLCNVQQSWYFVTRALKEHPEIQSATELFAKANELMVEELCKTMDNKELIRVVREI